MGNNSGAIKSVGKKEVDVAGWGFFIALRDLGVALDLEGSLDLDVVTAFLPLLA